MAKWMISKCRCLSPMTSSRRQVRRPAPTEQKQQQRQQQVRPEDSTLFHAAPNFANVPYGTRLNADDRRRRRRRKPQDVLLNGHEEEEDQDLE